MFFYYMSRPNKYFQTITLAQVSPLIHPQLNSAQAHLNSTPTQLNPNTILPKLNTTPTQLNHKQNEPQLNSISIQLNLNSTQL